MALFRCSDKAGFITGENICIDGGMTRLMIYHGEHGWNFAAIVPHHAMADSLMDEISAFIEENCEAEILEETREIR